MDLIKALLQGERVKVTEQSIAQVISERHDAIGDIRNYEVLPEVFQEYYDNSEETIPTPEEFFHLCMKAHALSVPVVIETMEMEISNLEDQNADLWFEYVRQVDETLCDIHGSDFLHTASDEDLRVEREKIMSTVPFEDFIP